jgi:hypothetical protein
VTFKSLSLEVTLVGSTIALSASNHIASAQGLTSSLKQKASRMCFQLALESLRNFFFYDIFEVTFLIVGRCLLKLAVVKCDRHKNLLNANI